MSSHRFSVLLTRLLTFSALLSILLSACSTVTNLGRGPIVNETPVAPLLTGGTAQPSIPQTGSNSPHVRLALYYDWYPEAWTQNKLNPDTNYQPSLGYYDSFDPSVIKQHIAAMQYGKIDAGLVSWAGQNTASDQRFPKLLKAANGTGFQWAIYYETSSRPSMSPSQAQADLVYILNQYGNDPNYLHIGGRFVVFVYNTNSTGCDASDLWKTANTGLNAFLVLKVVTGFRDCPNQPDGWYQVAPAASSSSQGEYSYTISPGFWRMGESPRLSRDVNRWYDSVRKMAASDARFQLITSFNDWINGSAIESSSLWTTPSGYGAFLDALHTDGAGQPLSVENLNTANTTSTPSPGTVTELPPQPVLPSQPPSSSSIQVTPVAPGSGSDPIILAAGDISSCASPGDFSTAKIIERFLNAPVLALGDTAYEDGSLTQFQDCFNPAWGSFKDRIHPAIGNHEYLTPNANGYFTYFGSAAGNPNQGWYSFDVGSWHIIALNSNCSKVGGCDPTSPQAAWLKADLAAHPTQCSLAYWHHPLFSSGEHGDQTYMKPIWDILYQAGVDIVLNGHDHDYERFVPVDPNGNSDPQKGITEFVVGTGGKNYYKFSDTIEPISAAHVANIYGMLELTLHPNSFDWKFIPEAGKTFTDSGSATCH